MSDNGTRPLRVLDLGAHDGFVSAWLKERYDGAVEIDGLELMPEAAERARERGINCKVGAAEQAPELFEAGSYDAVFAFELIEHVPDVDRFLTACEAMLAPGGRLYLSTPDGTFGAGNNPHHLRALRFIDLYDIVRARGTIDDGLIGEDGVSVLSYSPAPRRGQVAIYTGPSWMPWHPKDIETRGLGGSETAATRLAEHLSFLGFVVTIYGQMSEQGGWRDVMVRDWQTFDPIEPRLATIVSRQPQVFDRPLASKHRLLWLHDVDAGDELTAKRAERIDGVLVLSDWHKRHVAGRYPFVKDKLIETRNGFEPAYFKGEQPERKRRVVYTSSPDRGLDVLLELWPEIREQVPDATLAWAYSPVYFAIAEQDETVAKHAAKIRELSKQDGVEALESLTQPQVAQLMRESLVWAHPSWHTPGNQPFHETSCIGAMEAQAAGCAVVCSDWGALRETVKVGRKVNGDAPGEKWKRGLVKAIIEALTLERVQHVAQVEGPKAVADMSWQGVADQVAGLIDPPPTPSPSAPPAGSRTARPRRSGPQRSPAKASR